jgi:hypothetical protein
MRLITTSVATAAAVAVSATAFAASTNEITTTMSGTARLASGGQLTLTTKRVRGSRFRVTIHYNVQVRSKTVLGFAVYPCRSTSCSKDGVSKSKIKLGVGMRRVTFSGRVPVVQASSGGKVSKFACVFAQLRDQGPSGKAPGQIVRHGTRPGVQLCQDVSKKG